MPSLRDEQMALQAAVLAAEGRGDDPGRLAIYRTAYRSRLAGALRGNYPMLAQLLGKDEFERVAGEYAATRPSRHFSIRWHGDALSRSLPEGALRDLARMEWSLGTAFDAPDAAPIDTEFLMRVPVGEWGSLPLALHPSVSVLPMSWDVESQWESLRASATAAPCEAKPHSLLVWRKSLQAHWRIASTDEGLALVALREEGTLEAACEAPSPDMADQVGTWFAVWVSEGMLVARGETRR